MEVDKKDAKSNVAHGGTENEEAPPNQSNSPASPSLAHYHCDSCRRDLTNGFRIRCATCADYDLCVECFRFGKETGQHRHDHPYRILDRFAQPLFDPEWGADEEWLLIEGVEQFGLGNWADISEHVGSKSLEECRDHYIQHYINSPLYPLPNIEMNLDPDVIMQARKRRLQSPHKLMRKSILPPVKPKVQPSHPANHELQGFMPGRWEFDVEHENEAEVPVKDMIFYEDDPPIDVDLKVAMLEIYNQRLDKRLERRQFIFDRGLQDFKRVQANDRKRSREEKDMIQATKNFARFMTCEDYNEFISGLLAEQELRQRIAQLQEYRRMGITEHRVAEEYEQEKKLRLQKLLGFGALPSASGSITASSDLLVTKPRLSWNDIPGTASSSSGNQPPFRQPSAPLDLSGCDGVDRLTTSEQALCSTLRILPRAYLVIKQTLLRECERRGGLKRRDTRNLIKIDVNKLGKVYDFFVEKQWVYPPKGE